ncbi:adhesion G protein-coupled receptor E3 [Ailuropoda melanoleuca]|uniref:adhesion G protein-coupled receptor E3 n=1 Tax=Ailuropoda melanoleuca TaxID=9646 RepID=UPI0014942431|nr:adhesion G protein-coupled receptor E3 [Ailuropoda melanoleuca]
MRGPSLLPGLCFLLSLSVVMDQKTTASCNCPQHAYCVNDTHCTCEHGYRSDFEQQFFTFPLTTCQDINECDPPISIYCGANAACKNVDGGFHCRCNPGYKLLSGDTQFQNSNENTCQKTTSSATTKDMKDVSKSPVLEPNELQHVVETFQSLLTNNTPLGTGEKGAVATWATEVLQTVESAALETALKSPEHKIQEIHNNTVAIETRVVTDNCSEEGQMFSLNTHMNSVDIHCNDIVQGNIQGPTAIAFISYSSLGNIINATFFEEANERNQVYLNSEVVSAAIRPQRNLSLSKSVILSFQHVKRKPGTRKAFCVYWKSSGERGQWSRDGCFLMQVNESHTICSSTHLSSFAVLVAFTSQEEDPLLAVITYVGLGLSLLCLLLAALTFLLWKPEFCLGFKPNQSSSRALTINNYTRVSRSIISFFTSLCMTPLRMLTFKATAQLFILGCTWCLGILQVGPAAHVMAYLFTIVNSLQGVFIFLVYCLLSQQVRKWFGEIMKFKSESETYTLSTKFGADSKPSEVRGLVTYSNASPLHTPNPLSLS